MDIKAGQRKRMCDKGGPSAVKRMKTCLQCQTPFEEHKRKCTSCNVQLPTLAKMKQLSKRKKEPACFSASYRALRSGAKSPMVAASADFFETSSISSNSSDEEVSFHNYQVLLISPSQIVDLILIYFYFTDCNIVNRPEFCFVFQ